MAKGTITASTVVTNTIQSLPDVVTGQASSLKTKFDKGVLDTKTYINDTLIPELNGNNGSNKIGHNSTNIAADNVKDALEELYTSISQASTGDILDNSLANIKLANDIKVGSLASLSTSASSVTGAINAIDTRLGSAETTILNIATNKTLLDITRTAVTATGSNVAMSVDTVGTFDMTLNGNILHVVPNNANTGSITIAVDGLAARTIKKANDSGTLVDLEAGDIKAKSPILLVRDSVNDFFVLAPKSGAVKETTFRSVQSGTATRTDSNGLGTTSVTIYTLPTKTVHVNYYDQNTTANATPQVPHTRLQLIKSSLTGPGVTATLALFDSTGTLIGNIDTYTWAAGSSGTLNGYIYGFSLTQVGSTIRVMVTRLNESGVYLASYYSFTGNLAGATIRALGTITGTITGTISASTRVGGEFSVYTN